MTAIHSTETTRTGDMTTKLVFRGRRAIVAAAAVVACGLLAAPLQAEHVAYDVALTLTTTVSAEKHVTLTATIDGFVADPQQQTGFQYTMKGEDQEYSDDWYNMGDVGGSANVTVQDFIGYGDGPYHFKVRAWNARVDAGSLHFSYSPTTEASVDLTDGE